MSNWYEEPKIPARNFKIGFYSFIGFIGSIYLVKKYIWSQKTESYARNVFEVEDGKLPPRNQVPAGATGVERVSYYEGAGNAYMGKKMGDRFGLSAQGPSESQPYPKPDDNK
ncbi:hypothetical protein B0I72DRAFT_152164 [Yarrowia lipolytica]|uniref:Uncharacterized protein n=1 Tax=Yarrowia lipolytica TaxID=4952 RepID=A0A1H6PLE9_YARLL|nr:hypothetical protein YALI1_F17215g [Yarrowia lipolytica]KAB8280404.1 hypothetical protein BKA91DRAFT_130894 [Yarrowia lipolytica]KAE8168934.1 hypothetical protein BKA90DRAFT_171483 [Yarrowia lipolytica]KAJ8055779.1 hypothetical protein LXG23DRAFT_35416 [Yarrowia lipolytica]QNQ00709.1 Hypothetical protein YALI2_F00254g [Yarrowia lipolytica]